MSDSTVYVIGPAEIEEQADEAASITGTRTQLHSFREITEWLHLTAKEVSTESLLSSFKKAQSAIDAMLQQIDSQADRGFQLDEFEVSLAVSGKGTIGFATASAKAGVILKFKRGGSNAKNEG